MYLQASLIFSVTPGKITPPNHHKKVCTSALMQLEEEQWYEAVKYCNT